MKIREFIENAQVKYLEAQRDFSVGSNKVAYNNEILKIKTIGLEVDGDIDLMDEEIVSKDFKFNRITGEQSVIFNDNIIYNINKNFIEKASKSFGVYSEFSRKTSKKESKRVGRK